MFPNSPHLNHLVQAAVGSLYKGGEQQQSRTKAEKAREMKFLVHKDQKAKDLQKTDDAKGRMA